MKVPIISKNSLLIQNNAKSEFDEMKILRNKIFKNRNWRSFLIVRYQIIPTLQKLPLQLFFFLFDKYQQIMIQYNILTTQYICEDDILNLCFPTTLQILGNSIVYSHQRLLFCEFFWVPFQVYNYIHRNGYWCSFPIPGSK